jgi:competence protein ComEA
MVAMWQSRWAPIAGRALAVLAIIVILGHIGSVSATFVPLRSPAPGAPHQHPVTASSVGASSVGASSVAAGSVAASAGAAGAQLAVATHAHAEAAEPCRGGSAHGRVILNEAGVAKLATLPGIGKKRAQAIVAMRERLGGRFRRLRDLMRVKGIGYRSFKKLEPRLLLNRPPPAASASAKPSRPSS